MAEDVQWEYKIEVLGSAFRSPKAEAVQEALNHFGEEGWEAVSLHQSHNSNPIWITMKRRLTLNTRRRRSRPDEQW